MGQACCTETADNLAYDNGVHQQKISQLKVNPNSNSNIGNSNIPKNVKLCRVPTLKPQVGQIVSKLPTLQFKNSFYERGEEAEPYVLNKDGTVYYGEWKNQQPHGKGQMYFLDGSYYEGLFHTGLPHHEGRMINEVGVYYEGEIRQS